MGAQEILVAAEIILRAAADLFLHSLAVAATETGKLAGGAQLGVLMQPGGKCAVFG